jgi:hypothetical protein
MKLKHTQAKKANRISAFHDNGTFGTRSKRRALKRDHLQPKVPKTFGCMIVRTQRIFLKHDRFGAPIYRTIKHAAAAAD